MTTNFEVEDNYALFYKELLIDLHNDFNFIGYSYNVAEQHLILTWIKSSGIWVNKNDIEKITLLHLNVSFLKIDFNVTEREDLQDDQCLSELSFFSSEDRVTNNEFSIQSKPQAEDDIIYTFASGCLIRVGCNKIDLTIN